MHFSTVSQELIHANRSEARRRFEAAERAGRTRKDDPADAARKTARWLLASQNKVRAAQTERYGPQPEPQHGQG